MARARCLLRDVVAPTLCGGMLERNITNTIVDNPVPMSDADRDRRAVEPAARGHAGRDTDPPPERDRLTTRPAQRSGELRGQVHELTQEAGKAGPGPEPRRCHPGGIRCLGRAAGVAPVVTKPAGSPATVHCGSVFFFF